MRVALLITGLNRGGAETQLVRLACALAQRGWDVSVLSLLPPTQFTAELASCGVSVWTAGMQRFAETPHVLWKLTRELKRWQPHVLVCFMFHADILGRIAAWGSKVPVVISSVRSINMGGRHREWILRLTSGLVEAVTANAQMTVQYISEHNIAGGKPLYVMPNAIETEHFQCSISTAKSVRSELGADPDDFIWLVIGRLASEKDYPNLLKACAKLVSQGKKIRLWIAGEGSLEQDIKQFAADIAVETHCSFLGLRDDISRLLAGADAIVQASAFEGLPNALIEAFAARKPVVATNVGGTGELVIDKASGILVPAQNPLALAEAMIEMMEMPLEKRVAMGEAGYKHVAENYQVERVVRKWEVLFIRLLGKMGPSEQIRRVPLDEHSLN